ncbi:MAG: DUF3322 domain-containing protein [Terracidiphilus sp.]|jgi:hypothetical protein
MRGSPIWTTTDDLARQVEKLWARGAILSSLVTGSSIFPLRLALKAPSAADLRDRFGEVYAWLQEIRNAPCCRVVLREIKHRVQGANFLPSEVWIDSAEEALRLIGKQTEASRFQFILDTTRQRQPLLLDWLAQNPLRALAYDAEWERFLEIAAWLRRNPVPARYLRQVDIPGVHSKLIEANCGILSELFDIILPPDAIDFTASGAGQFEKRYGFLGKPPRIRFRVLDPSVKVLPNAINPDIFLDARSFAALDLSISRVFITENEVNFLAFPNAENSMVLFGSGYGFEMLRYVEWLAKCSVHYWGDIDTHGFAILDQLRGVLGERAFLAHGSRNLV